MGVPNAPCYQCGKRHEACHDSCEEYQAYKKAKLEFNLAMAGLKNYETYETQKKAKIYDAKVKYKLRGGK